MVFFARHRPASSIANPACIQNTRKPATKTQTVSRATRRSPTLFSIAFTSWAQALPGSHSNEAKPRKMAVRPKMGISKSSVKCKFLRKNPEGESPFVDSDASADMLQRDFE